MQSAFHSSPLSRPPHAVSPMLSGNIRFYLLAPKPPPPPSYVVPGVTQRGVIPNPAIRVGGRIINRKENIASS